MKKIEIGEKSKVNIKWNVRPVDYSHEGEDSIIAKFASKYGIPKANIQVEPVFIVKKEDGSDAVVTDGIIGNAQDPKFHQVLFKEYLTDNEITDVSFDDIKAVAFPALRHRIVPGFEAMADGIKVDEIIANIIASVPMN